MFKFAVGTAVLGLFLIFAGPSFAGGYHGPKHGGHGYYSHAYKPYRPPVHHYRHVPPYVAARPVYVAPPIYRPNYHHHGYYYGPSGGFYIQGRNFSFGIDY